MQLPDTEDAKFSIPLCVYILQIVCDTH